jgi:hypothetical protein
MARTVSVVVSSFLTTGSASASPQARRAVQWLDARVNASSQALRLVLFETTEFRNLRTAM